MCNITLMTYMYTVSLSSLILIHLKPQPFRYNLGLAHKKLLAIDEALQCFLDLHTVLPTNAEVVYQLGHCYELLKDNEMACDWFRKLSHLIPNDR